MKKYDILLGRTKRDGAPKRAGCHVSAKLCLWACCRNSSLGRYHTPRKGCVSQEQSWFSVFIDIGSWAGQHLAAMDDACLPSFRAMDLKCLVAFVAGLFYDLFFKMETIPGSYNFSFLAVFVLTIRGSVTRNTCPCFLPSLSSFNILIKLPSLELSVTNQCPML